jgi:serine/threonine protein kinase
VADATRTHQRDAAFEGERWGIVDLLFRYPGSHAVCRAVDAAGEEAIVRLYTRFVDERNWSVFRRAVRRRAGIKHPTLLSVRGADWTQQRPSVIFEPRAADLLTELIEDDALEPVDVLRLLADVADATKAIESRSLPAVEVTPGDIFVTRSGRGILMGDVGVASELHTHRGPYDELYLAPERFGWLLHPEHIQLPAGRFKRLSRRISFGHEDHHHHHDAPTPASTVFSFGCVLFEALTGSPPFDAEQRRPLLGAHTFLDAPSASARRSELPEEIDYVIARALANTPEERFRNPMELLVAAADALGIDRAELDTGAETAPRKDTAAGTAAAGAAATGIALEPEPAGAEAPPENFPPEAPAPPEPSSEVASPPEAEVASPPEAAAPAKPEVEAASPPESLPAEAPSPPEPDADVASPPASSAPEAPAPPEPEAESASPPASFRPVAPVPPEPEAELASPPESLPAEAPAPPEPPAEIASPPDSLPTEDPYTPEPEAPARDFAAEPEPVDPEAAPAETYEGEPDLVEPEAESPVEAEPEPAVEPELPPEPEALEPEPVDSESMADAEPKAEPVEPALPPASEPDSADTEPEPIHARADRPTGASDEIDLFSTGREPIDFGFEPASLEDDLPKPHTNGHGATHEVSDAAVAVPPIETDERPTEEREVAEAATKRRRERRARRRSRSRKGRTPALLALAAIGASVAAGVAIGQAGGDSEPETPTRLALGSTTLPLPSGWERGRAASLPFETSESALVARPSDLRGAGLVVTRASTGLASSQDAAGADRSAVRLGQLAAWRYAGIAAGSGTVADLYVAPTNAGMYEIACFARAADAARFLPTCGRVATGLRIRGAESLPLTGDDATRQQLSGTLATLGEQRVTHRKRLADARRPAGQAAAAGALSRAFTRAADSVAALPAVGAPGDQEQIVAALQAVGDQYASLSRAAENGDRTTYAAERRAVVAREQELRKAIDLLARAD